MAKACDLHSDTRIAESLHSVSRWNHCAKFTAPVDCDFGADHMPRLGERQYLHVAEFAIGKPLLE